MTVQDITEQIARIKSEHDDIVSQMSDIQKKWQELTSRRIFLQGKYEALQQMLSILQQEELTVSNYTIDDGEVSKSTSR